VYTGRGSYIIRAYLCIVYHISGPLTRTNCLVKAEGLKRASLRSAEALGAANWPLHFFFGNEFYHRSSSRTGRPQGIAATFEVGGAFEGAELQCFDIDLGQVQL
jgi:hypothetical protein